MSEPLTPSEREALLRGGLKVGYRVGLIDRLLDERDALEQRNTKILEENEDLGIECDTLRAQLNTETERADSNWTALERVKVKYEESFNEANALRARCEQLESEQEHTANAVDLISKIEAQRWGKLEARCEQLERDRQRLDWLERNHHHHNGQARFEVGELSVYGEHPTIRESIDAALAALSEPTTEQEREAK